MKSKLFAVLITASLFPALCAYAKDKIVLPDACGDESARFDVKTEKDHPTPAPPPAGKAQIVLFGEGHVSVRDFTYQTFRYGLDGAWVGANYDDSYFVLTVDPGVHHLCVNWQDKKKPEDARMYSATDSFTAEPGKTYYFSSLLRFARPLYLLKFSQLDDDSGSFHLKAWKLATSTAKK